eukprot:CAMPEP_0113313788 /NCGR_PEP_ID=MMETSP0010_2-20120614/10080_1 /TAXON_ID=216773 ORGANISM="Corethron hystrix, Strain 308" /NCGR_SAMPLE_ID=MMETSP0010_2 /ASSEMBLY_ACC=CAM_ASM_000155 /LENGTH=92 /DNA_ID=CAMNT_0000169887 /DNA_START=263 /DNA_END=538 /DNA_ORIENTATION=- /assembly_acc=CAM_ASM_000155
MISLENKFEFQRASENPSQYSSSNASPASLEKHKMLSKHFDPLASALSPVTHLCISDVTDGHAAAGFLDGRALAAEGREALILAVSSRFEGV